MEYRVARVSAVSEAMLRRWFSEADEARQAQVLQIRRAQAQKQCLCADHLAREMLHSRGVAPVFARDGNGRPYLLNSPLHFNLSHAGDFVACAVHESPVGIDLEALRSVSPALADKVCTAQEREFILDGGAFDSTRFLQIWTVKEAYLKYLGCGLRGNLREIEVVSDGRLALNGLHLHTALTSEYALAVVY